MKSGFLLAVLLLPTASGGEREQAVIVAQESGPRARQESGDSIDWKAVDEAMGRPGKPQPDGSYKYSLPRSDLKVSVAGVAVKPALALGSWVAFRQDGGRTMAMGDLVLTQNEIAPVMQKLKQMGVEPTALHNHVLHESPRVMYLHIEGEGDPVKIAQAVHAALSLTRTPPTTPESAAQPAPLGFDSSAVAQTLDYPGKVNGGVYQVSVPRADPVRVHGMTVPPSMGVATAINFQPTGQGKAAITGDFVMTAEEVGPVIRVLTAARIEVTALHSHMLMEEPRLFFAHFWANDSAVQLARGLRSALDKMRNKPGT